VVDFMRVILNNSNNFPAPAPMTREQFMKSLFTPPNYNSASR
jgi:hypothetical protein